MEQTYRWDDKDPITLTGKEFEILIKITRERNSDGIKNTYNPYKDALNNAQALAILEGVMQRHIESGVIKPEEATESSPPF